MVRLTLLLMVAFILLMTFFLVTDPLRVQERRARKQARHEPIELIPVVGMTCDCYSRGYRGGINQVVPEGVRRVHRGGMVHTERVCYPEREFIQ